MNITSTPLPGLMVVHTDPREDPRGQFERLFCAEAWSPLHSNLNVVQINHSKTTKRGTIRGLHYQAPPVFEAKLIRCIRGRVFDVAVDLRANSKNFLQWHAIELSGEDPSEVFIPEGFAHGFQSLTDDVEMLYMHTAPWTSSCEGGLRYDDPRLAITWPLALTLISDRDKAHPLVSDGFTGLFP